MASNLPLVTVIIPTYNRADSLRRTLDSLAQQAYPADRYEVLVVDDELKITEVLGSYLRRAGYVPLVAENGARLLDRLRT